MIAIKILQRSNKNDAIKIYPEEVLHLKLQGVELRVVNRRKKAVFLKGGGKLGQ